MKSIYYLTLCLILFSENTYCQVDGSGYSAPSQGILYYFGDTGNLGFVKTPSNFDNHHDNMVDIKIGFKKDFTEMCYLKKNKTLFFYNSSDGSYEIWDFKGQQLGQALQVNNSIEKGWTEVESYYIGETQFIVFYNRNNGFWNLYRVNEANKLNKTGKGENWAKGWNNIFFSKNYFRKMIQGGGIDLNFLGFSNANGEYAIYLLDSQGLRENLIQKGTNWNKDWSNIVAFRESKEREFILFYDKKNYLLYRYNNDPTKRVWRLSRPAKTGLVKEVTEMIPIDIMDY